MSAAGEYKGYNYQTLSEAEVDAIDAASPSPRAFALSRTVDNALLVEAGEIADGAVDSAAIEDGSVASADLAETIVHYAEVSLTKANILALAAAPVVVVAAPGAGKAIEFISAVVITDYATAAYTGGSDVVIKNSSGTVSNSISTGNSFGAASDKITACVALDTADGIPLVANGALTISVAAGEFTDPGTAAGVGRVKVAYRVHSTGL